MYEILIKKITDMKLTLKDRVLILNNVLPMYDNRKNIGLKISISAIGFGAEGSGYDPCW